MKQKGFTLIELLAVIIILGLIAVITIPMIDKTLTDSKKDIAKNSALNYKRTVEEYTLKQAANKNNINLNGTYNINENGYLYNETELHEISFNGEKPKNGYFTYIDNELQSGCIVINKYEIKFENGEISDIEKGNCEIEENTP